MLTRRKESDTYLTHVCSHPWSRQIMMKKINCSFQSALWLSSESTSVADVGHEHLFHLLSLRSFCSSDVYRRESGRCHSLPFFLKYFSSFYLSRFSFYISRVIVEEVKGKPTGRRPLGRPRCRWEGNTTMDLKRIDSAQDVS